MVRYRASEAYILKPHTLKSKQCVQTLVKSALASAQLVVFHAQTLDRDADADVRKLPGKRYDPVVKPSGR